MLQEYDMTQLFLAKTAEQRSDEKPCNNCYNDVDQC